jgi:hypothetical protein
MISTADAFEVSFVSQGSVDAYEVGFALQSS